MKKLIIALLAIFATVALAAAGDRYITNVNQDKDILFEVNDSGVNKTAMKIVGTDQTILTRLGIFQVGSQADGDTLQASLSSNAVSFNRPGSTSYIQNDGIGGLLALRTSASSSGDTTNLIMSSNGSVNSASVTTGSLVQNASQVLFNTSTEQMQFVACGSVNSGAQDSCSAILSTSAGTSAQVVAPMSSVNCDFTTSAGFRIRNLHANARQFHCAWIKLF